METEREAADGAAVGVLLEEGAGASAEVLAPLGPGAGPDADGEGPVLGDGAAAKGPVLGDGAAAEGPGAGPVAGPGAAQGKARRCEWSASSLMRLPRFSRW